MKPTLKQTFIFAASLSLGACASTPPLGQSTHAWTDLQRSNVAALGWARPLPGDAADKIYQRYLNSFGQPIPETFTRKSFASE
jgi:hypothetical protein